MITAAAAAPQRLIQQGQRKEEFIGKFEMK